MSMHSRAATPKAVQRAVILLYAALVLALFQIILGASDHHVHWPIFFAMFGPFFGFMIFLTVMISRGRNWARVTYLVLFAVFLIPSVISLIHSFLVIPFFSLVKLAQLVSGIVALVLLFSRKSSEWFTAKPTPNESA